jgi:hypothetical protein
MTAHAEMTSPHGAAILEAGGLQPLEVDQAMQKVRAALSEEPTISRDIYAVIVYGKAHSEPDHLRTVNTIFTAYWRSWRTLSRLASVHLSSPHADHLDTLTKRDMGDICVFWGRGTAKDVKNKLSTSPGVYLIPSHLDADFLVTLGLPPLPEPFRHSPVVVQVKWSELSGRHTKMSEEWNPWESLARLVSVEERAASGIEKDTLEWREQFMSENKCWTSAEVAKESSSTAKNRAAIASRWLAEKRIFSVHFKRQTWFPRFQFQDGSPIPAISNVIKAFPKHATGWDLAFFFDTPNSFIGGRRPLELLKGDPEAIESLAHRFANPTDAF